MITLLVLTDDDPATIGRIMSVTRQRNLRLDSATVSRSQSEDSVTVLLRLDLEQSAAGYAAKYLNRVVAVRKVTLVTDDRALAIVTCILSPALAFKLMTHIGSGARILSSNGTTATIELSGPTGWVDDFLGSLDPSTIRGVVRSGPVALRPGWGR